MKKSIKVSLYLFALMAIFFVSNFINSNIVFASIPQIVECKFNNNDGDIIFNPNSSTLSIDLFFDQDVKFNTVSLCRIEDPVCSRSTAVKYFTNTSSYLSSLNKIWDGKTGGSNPSLVSSGDYRVRITAVNQDTESNSPGDYCVSKISVVFSDDEEDPGGGTSTTTATTTDPIIATTTATTTTITTPTAPIVISVHYIQESVSDYEEPINIFELGVGRDRLSYVGSPVNFQAKYKTSNDLKGKTPKYIWSLGDGFISSDKEVTHTYKYPGDYNVVLNASIGDINSVSRTKVKVLIPELLLSITTGGDVDITNRGNNEINLYGLKLKSENKEYSFPLDTIISAKSSVIFPLEYLGLSTNSGELSLVDSQEKKLSQIKPEYLVANSDKMVTFEEFEKFALEYRKSILVPIPVNSNQINQIFVNNVSNQVQVNPSIPLTASVASTFIKSSSSVQVVLDENNLIIEDIQRGFWSKLFHPIRTIQEAFYE
jgi:hypothetical protein